MSISYDEYTVGRLATEMPNSIRVFEAWRIDYCCGGKTPLAEACAAVGKSVDEFAATLATLAVVPENTRQNWDAIPLREIAGHICEVYHRFTREELQTLTPLSQKVRSVHGERHPEVVEVADLVRQLVEDMPPHMLKEEQVLFPYVEQLEDAIAAQRPAPIPFFGTVKNPVRMMMLEHDNVGELLARLRAVTSNYALPDGACFSYRELYRRLAEFETRTHEHVHIENNIYFPRAVALEEKAGNTAQVSESPHFCGH